MAGEVERSAERVQRSSKVRSGRYAGWTVEWLPQCCVWSDCIHGKSVRIWRWRGQFGVWAVGGGGGGQWGLHGSAGNGGSGGCISCPPGKHGDDHWGEELHEQCGGKRELVIAAGKWVRSRSRRHWTGHSGRVAGGEHWRHN